MFLITKRSNIEAAVTNLLKHLNVTIHSDIIIEELEKHPDYPSMLAVSDVLTTLNIANEAFRAEATMLRELPVPFLASLKRNEGEIVVVTKIDSKHIYFADHLRNVNKLSVEIFNSEYSGVVLIAEPKSDLIKPRRVFRWTSKLKSAVITSFTLLVLLSILFNNSYSDIFDWKIAFLSLIKTAGLIVSILLLIQSIDSSNPLIQAVCKSGKKTDCNAILSSKAAEVFEGLTWSEVGFFYFSGTWLLLHLSGALPGAFMILTYLNLMCLPFTIYSIYYQARIAKKWCILCCVVQIVIWLEFVPLIFTFFGSNLHSHFVDFNILRIAFISFSIPAISWLILRPLIFKVQELKPLKGQLHTFKYNVELFKYILAKQPQFEQPNERWSIVLGENNAENVITMVSNPYCQPCAKMHKLLNDMIDQNDNVQVRIVFTALNIEADHQTPVARHFMALSSLPDKTLVKTALHTWYEQTRKDYRTWAHAFPVQLEKTDFFKLDEQRTWCEMAQVAVTPTILINGHVLPSIYQMNDLRYML